MNEIMNVLKNISLQHDFIVNLSEVCLSSKACFIHAVPNDLVCSIYNYWMRGK